MNYICFGIPSIFSFKSKTCASCGSFENCQNESYLNLMLVQGQIDVSDAVRSHQNHFRAINKTAPLPTQQISLNCVPKRTTAVARVPHSVSEYQRVLIESLPRKVGDYMRKLILRGFVERLVDCMNNNENPFDEEGYRPYCIAFEKLKSGGFSRSVLKTAFQNEMGWSVKSAASQVSFIWSLMPALGIAKEDGYSLVPVIKQGEQVGCH